MFDADGGPRVYPPLAGIPVAPLRIAVSLRKRRDLVARHPDPFRIHPELKPWLSAGGVEPFILHFLERALISQQSNGDPFIYLVMPVLFRECPPS